MGGAVIGLRPGEAAPCQVGPLGGGGGGGRRGWRRRQRQPRRATLQRPVFSRSLRPPFLIPPRVSAAGEGCGGGGRRGSGAAVNGPGWGQRNAGGARGRGAQPLTVLGEEEEERRAGAQPLAAGGL